MDNYIDFKNFSGKDIKTMLREKQKEYIILIQSEKIAKMILDDFKEPYQTTEYHYRLNKEYYTLYQCAIKKQAITNDEFNNITISIPISSIIKRFEENTEFSDDYEKKTLYKQIINDFEKTFNNVEIIYENGFLFFTTEDKEKILLDKDTLKEYVNKSGRTYKKTK